MTTHWTGVDVSVHPNHTLATNTLIVAPDAFYLQVSIFFQANVAGSPLVLRFHGPGRYNGVVLPGVVWPSGVRILEGLMVLEGLMALVVSGHHSSYAPLQSVQ